MLKQWYEELFINYAKNYDNESFTKGTGGEVDFIEQEIDYDQSKTILDVGCGTGRHSIELAKRGYQVVGIDLSESQLQRAKEKAKAAEVKVTFLTRDACVFSFKKKFDLVIMLCEGAFPLMETDEMNFKILQNAAKALKRGGKFIFTTLNALFPLFHSVKDFINANARDAASKTNGNTFDLMTFRDYSIFTTKDDSGKEKTLHCNERYYTPSEISWLLKSLYFKEIGIFGCNTGDFNRKNKLTTENYEMLVIAKK